MEFWKYPGIFSSIQQHDEELLLVLLESVIENYKKNKCVNFNSHCIIKAYFSTVLAFENYAVKKECVNSRRKCVSFNSFGG